MHKGFIVSVLLHVSILLWALMEFPFAREFDAPETPSLPVDLVTPSELTKIKAGTADAKKETPSARRKEEKPSEAKKEEPRRQEAKKAAEAAPEPAPRKHSIEKPESKPEPERADKKKAEAAPPPLPRPAPPKPKVAEKKEPLKPVEREAPKAKSQFNPDRIAALLNKVPDAGPKSAPSIDDARPEPPARGMTSGADLAMSMSELDALRAKISQCWIPPVGGMGAERIKVRLRLQLNPDGSLMRPPDVVDRESSPFFQVAADSAVRAVWQCQPYLLPPAKYALWRDMILNFDPREMFGG